MIFTELEISGCYIYNLNVLKDARGSFIKTFHNPTFIGTPLEGFTLEEEFITTSHKNVLRGLHFQAPPMAHDKIVSCLSGSVLDFFLDIRRASPTYGKVVSIELTGHAPQFLFLPKGIAHGFVSKENGSVLQYKTNKAYSPESDAGILWSSIDVDLGVLDEELIISERDNALPEFRNYRSLF